MVELEKTLNLKLTAAILTILLISFFVASGQQSCDLPGDTAPCGEVTLGEVIDLINLWAADGANLSDVINLINAWANPTTTTLMTTSTTTSTTTLPANISTLCDGSAEKVVNTTRFAVDFYENPVYTLCLTEGTGFIKLLPEFGIRECCSGLTAIPNISPEEDNESCLLPECPCYVCTRCGDGICTGESWCNCLDCPAPNGTNVSCEGEGGGVGYPGICCTGLTRIDSCDENTGECDMFEGYCTNCGDGECVSPENRFSCPDDCYPVSLCIPRDVNITSASIDVTSLENMTYPNLDLGNDGDAEWNYTGEFNTTLTLTNLSQEINYYLSNCSEDPCEIPLRFHSSAVAEIRISNIAIWYQ